MARKNRDVSRIAPNSRDNEAHRLETSKKTKLKPSSVRWLKRQAKDLYVQSAKREGYRSRAAYKLIELDDKFKFFKPGQHVVDLGAAPGGWTQVAVSRVHALQPGGGRVLAVDIKPLDPVPGATMLTADFLAQATMHKVWTELEGKADGVLSDMALPATGHRKTDALRVMTLCEAALEFAVSVLTPGGYFLGKILKVGAETSLTKRLNKEFLKTKHSKPPASRKDSSESYIVATGYRGSPK